MQTIGKDTNKMISGTGIKLVLGLIQISDTPEMIPTIKLIEQKNAEIRPARLFWNWKLNADLSAQTAKKDKPKARATQKAKKTIFTRMIKPFSKILAGIYINLPPF